MTTAPATIAPLSGPADLADVSALVWAFFDEMKARNPHMVDEIDFYIVHHDVAGDLERLAAPGGTPGTACYLARKDGAAVGTLMLKPFGPETCELNRMYVAPAGRGAGIGRALVEALMEEARSLGYRRVRLSTVDTFTEALALYRAMGFTPDPNPTEFERDRDFVVSLIRAL